MLQLVAMFHTIPHFEAEGYFEKLGSGVIAKAGKAFAFLFGFITVPVYFGIKIKGNNNEHQAENADIESKEHVIDDNYLTEGVISPVEDSGERKIDGSTKAGVGESNSETIKTGESDDIQLFLI